MLKLAPGDETMSRTQTFDWFSKFKSGVMSACSWQCWWKCGLDQGTYPWKQMHHYLWVGSIFWKMCSENDPI